MGLAPVRKHRRPSRSARGSGRDHNPPARHKPGKNGGEGGRTGESPFDDEVARRFEPLKDMRGHQSGVERGEGSPRCGRRGRPALDPPLARAERSALVGEGGQSHDARGNHAGDVSFVRVGRRVAGKHRELTPAHEARGRHGNAAHIDVGQHVGFLVETAFSPDGHDDDPSAGRDDRERIAP